MKPCAIWPAVSLCQTKHPLSPLSGTTSIKINLLQILNIYIIVNKSTAGHNSVDGKLWE